MILLDTVRISPYSKNQVKNQVNGSKLAVTVASAQIRETKWSQTLYTEKVIAVQLASALFDAVLLFPSGNSVLTGVPVFKFSEGVRKT